MIRSNPSVLVVGVLATSAILLLGCSNKKPHPSASSTTQITSETLVRTDTRSASTDPREEYAKVARGDLDNLDRRIGLLETRPAGLTAGERTRTANDLREARAKLRELRRRVEAVSSMQPAVFAVEQDRLQADWDTLNAKVERIGDRLSAKP
ncbi:hypothetical protein LZC95_26215 [Pendulispora brunnea]|uniref:Uncharacterized protein n=1 Tax=Pendulispora brunnea TaxID=2905690 RepID=A0ABZ2JU28_9BACT